MITRKSIFLGCVIIVFIIVCVDRFAWASISQWREDQATNLWLGYTQTIFSIPVGLISSYSIPNPNGMVLLATFLSRLPGLWWVSFFIGSVQAVLSVCFCRQLFGKNILFVLTSVLLLSSVALRIASIEFWNQWMMTLFNLLFMATILSYNHRPDVYKLPLLVLLIFSAPTLYLAGLVNAVVYVMMSLWIIFNRPVIFEKRKWIISTALSILIVCISLILTWIPYFREVGLTPFTQVDQANMAPISSRLNHAYETFALFPVWSTTWAEKILPSIYFIDENLLSPELNRLIGFHNLLLEVQAWMCYLAVLCTVVYYFISKTEERKLFLAPYEKIGFGLTLTWLFILLSFMVSPELKGPLWAFDERLDQTVQFLPFMLVIWFGFPAVLRLPNLAGRFLRVINLSSAALFIVLNVVIGVQLLASHLSYSGPTLPWSDVPLRDKVAVIDFIAQDWQSKSDDKTIPVYYDLFGHWTWVPEFGQALEVWYPAPMTIGRAFDYQFLRLYGLHNNQEGNQMRQPGTERYHIGYAFLPGPVSERQVEGEKIIGRLRITIYLH